MSLAEKVAEINQAIQDEHNEVASKISTLETEIQALKDQIANGQGVTVEDLDNILTGVKNILVVEPEPPVEE